MTNKHHKSKKQEPARPERLLPKPNAKIRVNILYDDGHVLALDKPVGLPTQPGRGHIDDTLVNAAFSTHGEVGNCLHVMYVSRNEVVLLFVNESAAVPVDVMARKKTP